MIRYLFIRHATTTGLERDLVQGSTDSPLSPRGLREAQVTAQALSKERISTCFSSPLGRATQTADILCAPHQLTPVLLEELREMSFGWMEGRVHGHIPTYKNSLFIKLHVFRHLYMTILNGESIRSVRQRAGKAWEFLQNQAQDSTLLVVTHGILLNYFLNNIFPEHPVIRLGTDMHACGITEIVNQDHQPQLIRLNDNSHLKDLPA